MALRFPLDKYIPPEGYFDGNLFAVLPGAGVGDECTHCVQCGRFKSRCSGFPYCSKETVCIICGKKAGSHLGKVCPKLWASSGWLARYMHLDTRNGPPKGCAIKPNKQEGIYLESRGYVTIVKYMDGFGKESAYYQWMRPRRTPRVAIRDFTGYNEAKTAMTLIRLRRQIWNGRVNAYTEKWPSAADSPQAAPVGELPLQPQPSNDAVIQRQSIPVQSSLPTSDSTTTQNSLLDFSTAPTYPVSPFILTSVPYMGCPTVPQPFLHSGYYGANPCLLAQSLPPGFPTGFRNPYQVDGGGFVPPYSQAGAVLQQQQPVLTQVAYHPTGLSCAAPNEESLAQQSQETQQHRPTQAANQTPGLIYTTAPVGSHAQPQSGQRLDVPENAHSVPQPVSSRQSVHLPPSLGMKAVSVAVSTQPPSVNPLTTYTPAEPSPPVARETAVEQEPEEALEVGMAEVQEAGAQVQAEPVIKQELGATTLAQPPMRQHYPASTAGPYFQQFTALSDRIRDREDDSHDNSSSADNAH